MSENLNRILLLRTDRIGDVVLTTPVVSVLRNRFPNLNITFMARDYTRPLLEQYPEIDDIFVYEPGGKHKGIRGHWCLSQELKQRCFDAAIFFYPRPQLAAAVKLAGIPFRIGNGYKWYSTLFNERIFEHRKHGNRHELEHNLSMLQPLVAEIPSTITYNFQLSDSLLEWQKTYLRKRNIVGNYIIIHPGSGGSAPNLSLDQYKTVLQTILQNYAASSIIFTGVQEETSVITKIIDGADKRVVNAAGDFNIEQLMAIIRGAKLLVASSTGPIHIANALGVPVVGFYCPAAPCSPRRWGPYHQPEWVLMPQEIIPCDHCNPEKCHNGNCLETISINDLGNFIKKRLREI